jgi:amidase
MPFRIFSFLVLMACCLSCSRSLKDTAYLEEISIRQLQDLYASGERSAEQVTADYLLRIEQLDRRGPQLNSIILVNPNALQEARLLDEERKAGHLRGPLHGIPVIVKDNLNTHDMPTTAGARALQNSVPSTDSWLVKRLRDAGAVIIAKANLSEWANFRSRPSSSGWSGVGGQTRNPYVLDRNPSGSSAGSGAAASANLCVFAIGTETNGSIMSPSTRNGLVGLKPTVGLISRNGIIPISATQDTPGPMARSVEDIAVSLGQLVGTDPVDSITRGGEGKRLDDYTAVLKMDGLKGKRLGVLRRSMGFHGKTDSLFKQALRDIQSQGAELVDLDFTIGNDVGQASFQVLLYEFKAGVNAYLTSLGDNAPVKDLAGIIAFNKRDSLGLRFFNQVLLEQSQAKGDLTDKAYQDARALMLKATRDDGIDKLLKDYKLDALLSPTGAPAGFTDWINGDHQVGGSSTLAAVAGYPSLTVPMGFVEELPVGISFTAGAWQEATLLEMGYAYEQATKHRRKPTFLTTRGWEAR